MDALPILSLSQLPGALQPVAPEPDAAPATQAMPAPQQFADEQVAHDLLASAQYAKLSMAAPRDEPRAPALPAPTPPLARAPTPPAATVAPPHVEPDVTAAIELAGLGLPPWAITRADELGAGPLLVTRVAHWMQRASHKNICTGWVKHIFLEALARDQLDKLQGQLQDFDLMPFYAADTRVSFPPDHQLHTLAQAGKHQLQLRGIKVAEILGRRSGFYVLWVAMSRFAELVGLDLTAEILRRLAGQYDGDVRLGTLADVAPALIGHGFKNYQLTRIACYPHGNEKLKLAREYMHLFALGSCDPHDFERACAEDGVGLTELNSRLLTCNPYGALATQAPCF